MESLSERKDEGKGREGGQHLMYNFSASSDPPESPPSSPSPPSSSTLPVLPPSPKATPSIIPTSTPVNLLRSLLNPASPPRQSIKTAKTPIPSPRGKQSLLDPEKKGLLNETQKRRRQRKRGTSSWIEQKYEEEAEARRRAKVLAKKEAKKKRREEEEAHRHKYDLVDEKKLRRANVEMVPNYRFKSIIKKDLAEQAQRLNLFQQMPSHMSKVLIEALNFRRLGVEEFVFRQGEVGTDFNLIISGAVAIFRDDDSSTISATAPAEDAAKTVVSTVSTTDAMKPNTSLVARRHGVCAVVAVNDNQSKKNSDTGSQHEHGTKKTKSSTQTQFICVVRDFDGLGVNALLHGDPYEITAVTVEETILGTLTREAYLQLMELHFPSPFVSPSIELAVRTLPWQRTLRDLSIMADFMNRGKLLQMLSPPAKSELSLLCEYVSLSDGYVLFQEGNDSQFMYFVISGSVSEHRLEGQKKPMKPSKINLDRNRASLSKLSISNNVVCSTSGSIGNDKNLKKTDAGTKSSFPHPVGSPLRKKTQLIQLTHNTSISPPEFVDANTVSDLPPTLEEVSEVQGGSLQGELSNRRQEAGKSKLAKSVEASKRSAKRKNRIRPWMEADQAKRAEETKALAMVEVKRKKGVMRKLNRSVKSIVHGVRITAAIGRKTQEYGETLHVSAWGRNMSIKHVFGTAERLLNKGSFFGLSCDSIFQFGGADFDREYFETKIEQLLKSHIGPDKREQMNIRRAALVKSLKRKKMLNKVKVAGSMLSTQRKLRRTTFVQAPTLALLTEKEKTGASGSSDKEEEKERMQMREFQVTNTKYQFVWSAFQQFNDKQRLSRAASKNENTVQSRPISSTAVIPSSSSSSSSPPDVTNFVVGLEANRKYKTKESTPEAQVHTANLRKTSVITRSNCVLARVHLGAFMTLLCDLVDPPLKNYGNIMKFLHTQIHARSSDDAMMLIDVFKEHAFFKAHNSDTVVQLAQFATYHKVQAQDIIYKQGDMSAEDCLYVVLSGSISKHVMFERDDEPVKMYADDDELDNTLGDDDEGHTFLTGVIDGAEEDDDKDDEAEREIMNKERRKAKERAELYARLTDVRSIDDIEELFGPCHELVSSGHCFGEMALVGRSKREATLIARGPVELIAVSKAAYRKVTTSSNDNANQLANSGEDELNHEADDSEAGSRSQFALSDSQRPLQLARVIKILNEEEPLYRTPVSIMFLERQLKRFPLFRAMTPQMRIFIYQRMTHRRVKKQHILYREGDEGKDLRLILQGSVGLHERDFVAVQILLWRHRARLRIRNRVEEEDKRISEETHILLRELRRRDSVVDISASLGDIDECEVADIEDQREVENETDYVNTAIKRPQSSNINGEGSNSDDSDETSDMPSLERLSTFTQELDNNPRNHSESLLHNIDDQMKNARRKSRSFSRKFNYIHNKKKRRASARFKEIVKLDVYDEDLVSEESLAFTKSQSNTRKLLLDHMRQRLGMGAKDDSTECSDGSGGGGGSGSGSEDDSADEWVTSSADAGDETNVGRRGLKNADLGNFSDDGSNDDYCDGSSDIGGIYGTEEESDEEKSTPRKKNGEEKDTCKDEGDESNDPNVSTSSNALAEIRMTGFYHDPIHGPCVSVKTQTMAFGYKELQTLTVRSIRAHTAVTRELSDFLVVKQEDFLCTARMIHRPEGDSQKILRFLTKLPLFEAVDKFSILKLVNKMTLKRVRAKEIVFNQGDFVDHVYFIVQGKCKLTTRIEAHSVTYSNIIAQQIYNTGHRCGAKSALAQKKIRARARQLGTSINQDGDKGKRVHGVGDDNGNEKTGMSAKEAHRMMQMRRISLGGSILNTEINPRKMHERNAYNEAMSATKKKLQSSIEWKEDRIVALVPNRHGVFQPIHVLPQQLKHPFRHVHIFTNRNFVCQPHARLLSVGEDSDSGIHGPQIHASLTKIRKRENINSGGGMSSKKNKRNRTLDDEVTEFDRRGHTKNALSHKHDPKKCLQSHWNRFQKYSYNKPVMTASLREKTRANMLLNDNTDNTDNRDRDYGGDVIDSLVDTQTEITTLADGDCFGGTLHLYLSEERHRKNIGIDALNALMQKAKGGTFADGKLKTNLVDAAADEIDKVAADTALENDKKEKEGKGDHNQDEATVRSTYQKYRLRSQSTAVSGTSQDASTSASDKEKREKTKGTVSKAEKASKTTCTAITDTTVVCIRQSDLLKLTNSGTLDRMFEAAVKREQFRSHQQETFIETHILPKFQEFTPPYYLLNPLNIETLSTGNSSINTSLLKPSTIGSSVSSSTSFSSPSSSSSSSSSSEDLSSVCEKERHKAPASYSNSSKHFLHYVSEKSLHRTQQEYNRVNKASASLLAFKSSLNDLLDPQQAATASTSTKSSSFFSSSMTASAHTQTHKQLHNRGAVYMEFNPYDRFDQALSVKQRHLLHDSDNDYDADSHATWTEEIRKGPLLASTTVTYGDVYSNGIVGDDADRKQKPGQDHVLMALPDDSQDENSDENADESLHASFKHLVTSKSVSSLPSLGRTSHSLLSSSISSAALLSYSRSPLSSSLSHAQTNTFKVGTEGTHEMGNDDQAKRSENEVEPLVLPLIQSNTDGTAAFASTFGKHISSATEDKIPLDSPIPSSSSPPYVSLFSASPDRSSVLSPPASPYAPTSSFALQDHSSIPYAHALTPQRRQHTQRTKPKLLSYLQQQKQRQAMVDAKKKVPVDLLDRSKLASTSHSFVPRSWDDRHQQHMQLRSSNQFIKRELMKQKTLERKSSRVNIHGQEVNATNLRVTEDHQTQRVRKKNESEHTTDGGPGMSTSKKLILSAKRGRCRNGPEKKRCERGIRKHGQKKEKQRKGRRKGHGNSQRQALSPPFRRTRLHLLKADPRNHKQRRKHTPNVIHPDRFTGESAASSYVAHKTAVLVNMLKDTHCRLGESISDRIKRELDTRKRKERLEQVSQYYGAAEDDSFSLQQQHVGKPHQPQGTCGSVSSAKEEEEENSTGNFADNKDEEGERCSNKEIIQQEIGTGKL